MRILTYFCAVALIAALTTTTKAQFVLDDSGQIQVDGFNIVGGGGSNDNDINSTLEAETIWNHLDANPGFTGTTPNLGGPGSGIYNVANNHSQLSGSFSNGTGNQIDFAGGGGNFGINNPYSDIAGGAGLGGDDFSVRARTFIEFTAGGDYTIGAGADDGQIIKLTEALPGSAPGYSGITTVAGQLTGGLTSATEFGYDGTGGHNSSRGEFTVAAGDVLALDSFFFERGGGDSFEVFLGQGHTAGSGPAGSYQVLDDNLFNGAIQLHTSIAAAVPEPTTIAIWSLLGLALVGFGYGKYRSK